METIAIIGGGFSGTMTAVNLARLGTRPLLMTQTFSGRPAGRGVAYGTRRPEHLLNVAARNMSAFPDHPNHFLDWLRTRTEYADLPDVVLREAFVPRRVYGDYLRAVAVVYTTPVGAGSVAGRWLPVASTTRRASSVLPDASVTVAPPGPSATSTAASSTSSIRTWSRASTGTRYVSDTARR